MRIALEVSEVPPRGDEVRAHALDGVHEHPGGLDGDRMPLVHEQTGREEPRPEAVDDVALCVLRVGPEV